MPIAYKSGYKYQLASDYVIDVDIYLTANTQFLVLDGMGSLFIKSGYAWDGPSGPTLDTKNFMRGALIHDSIYQLMREGYVPESYREHADRLLQKICIADGMTPLRAWWVYKGVRFGGGPSAACGAERPVQFAP